MVAPNLGLGLRVDIYHSGNIGILISGLKQAVKKDTSGVLASFPGAMTRKVEDIGRSDEGRTFNGSSDSTRYESCGLMSHPGGELRKELPCEVIGVVWVACILAAKIVVEDSAVGGFVDVG
jgi:hypothetical protein